MSNIVGVVGVDGHNPIYDNSPDARWNMWSIHQVWLGEEGENKFVPKVNDYVLEPESGLMYIVVSLDPITFVPELSRANLKQGNSVDSLLSITEDNFRVYYDKTTRPFSLTVDGFFYTHSLTATFARIYRGSFLEPSNIISRLYNNNGEFIGHDVPLSLVAFNSHDNYGIKSIPSCNTDVELRDGELATVVTFTSDGKVVSKAACIIEDTSYVTQAYAEQRYITQIFIKSSFLDELNPTTINYPINLPIVSFNPIGVVQYNDGSQIEYPVDGQRFSLFGLDTFVSTIIGHKVPLVLSYKMTSTEAALANVSIDGNFITRPYELIVSEPNRSYDVKLFIYPIWIDEVTGYNYKVYMTNLDRNIMYDVTSKVTISTSSPGFNPLAYGITQRLTFVLNLNDVVGSFRNFQHVQTVDILLRAPANNTNVTNIWEVSHEAPGIIPYYGTNLRAILNMDTRRSIVIDNGSADQADFLDKLYWSTGPLSNPVTETQAPTPTHMEVKYDGEVVLVEMKDYYRPVIFNKDIERFSNVEIMFYKQVPGGWLKLSVAVLTVR